MGYRVYQPAKSGNDTWIISIVICLFGLTAILWDAYEYRGFYATAHHVTGIVIGERGSYGRSSSNEIYIYLPPGEPYRQVAVPSLHSAGYHSNIDVLVSPTHPKKAVLPGMRMNTKLGLWFFPLALLFWLGGFIKRPSQRQSSSANEESL